jgi:2C-methyl-D-erythritol 2,4-cyclodiphosphate synthase
MSAALARVLGIEPSCVSIKAKSNEGMGFIGRGEGIAVLAVATVEALR